MMSLALVVLVQVLHDPFLTQARRTGRTSGEQDKRVIYGCR